MSPTTQEHPEVEASKSSFPIELLQGVLPQANVDEKVDHAVVAALSLANLNQLDEQLLTTTAVWRDLYAMTGTLRTFNRPESIMPAWKKRFLSLKPYNFILKPESSKIIRLGAQHSWIQAKFNFKTASEPRTNCSGILGVVPDSESPLGWKIWLIITMLEELEGIPSPDTVFEAKSSCKTNGLSESSILDCVIVGAGFSGLTVAARLKAMGIRNVVLDRNANIGDNWLNRYESARYHTSKYFSDFPCGGVFTKEEYPYFLDIKSLAHGFQEYVKKHGLDVCSATTLKSASYDEHVKIWTLTVESVGTIRSIQTAHIVMAVGIGGQIPKMPMLQHPASFKGTVFHSVDYKHARKWKGQRGVVIGSANTGHDVASDMVEAGLASVTIVQRSRTPVYPIEHYKKWSDAHYNEQKGTDMSDRDILSLPIAILRKMSLTASKAGIDNEHQRFDALESAGFKVERYCDLWKALAENLGGHYQDVGCSAKIAAGLIKIKNDALPVSYTPNGLEFSDGSILEADVIVFCTGFENDVRADACSIFGPSVARKLDDCWGLDQEGELRLVFKPTTGCPGLWYTGGGVNHARFFSRFIALAIKADRLHKPLQVYAENSF